MSITEYDLKATVYSTYDTPHKLYNISGILIIQQSGLPTMIREDPYVSSNAPFAWIK